MRALILLVCVVIGLSACGRENARVRFDGELFRGSAKAVDKADRRDFVASVRPISASLEGAREALRYEGTKYCIKWFGISEIDWQVDPQAEATSLPVQDDRLTVRGRCNE